MPAQETEGIVPASAGTVARHDKPAWRALLLLSLVELLAMSLWFTGTAVIPQVTALWHSGLGLGSWLTIAVQIGFSVGAVTFALFNVPDLFSPPRVMAISSLAAAVANAAFAYSTDSPIASILLRAATGFFLAGVYPVGMKVIAGWFQRGRGLALGTLIGALTVGSAVPHAVNSLGGIPWRAVVLVGSLLALIAAVIVSVGVREGPYATAATKLDFSQVGQIIRNRRLRLANLGYLGHMWELYSMWAWIAVILAKSAGWSRMRYEIFAALTIAIGAVGCVWAGRVSDKLQDNPVQTARTAQRARVTIIAMAVSSACCLAAALVFPWPWALVAVALIWGIAIIADSAQFSAIISEVSEKSYMGTALTMQTAVGFMLTAIAIRAIAAIAAHSGWRVALAAMAIGPMLGCWAMSGFLRPREQLRKFEEHQQLSRNHGV